VRPQLAEALQLVPVVVLASSFIVSGEVDLSRAGPLFGVAAVLTVPITVLVRRADHALNPILTGTTIWLWVGAVAFLLPIAPLAWLYVETQAVGLFVAALGVGLWATLHSEAGYIGRRHPDPAWVRRWSLVLIGATLLMLAWAWAWRHDIRLGGGLPFIALNVGRRVVLART